MNLLPSVLVQVCSMSDNANSEKQMNFYSILAYKTDFIAHSDIACVTCSISYNTRNTDMNFCVACIKIVSFFYVLAIKLVMKTVIL